METILSDHMDIAVSTRPADAAVYVRIAGDVDVTNEPALARAASWLSTEAPHTVFVDLGGITFAGATLVTFLVRVINAIPPGSSLVLCRPTPNMRRVLWLMSMHLIATLRDGLPPHWLMPELDPATTEEI